jgi:hypothetical protein
MWLVLVKERNGLLGKRQRESMGPLTTQQLRIVAESLLYIMEPWYTSQQTEAQTEGPG